jgi:imidazole glycerol-phosphate synthase subunit HisH
MVGIIDVGVGNIQSIKNWLDRCIVNWEIIDNSKSLENYSLLILPGVGSAKLFVERLHTSGFFLKLIKAHSSGQRILGICLGAQVFMDHLEEGGGVDGFGFIKGTVIKLPLKDSNTGWLPFSFDRRILSYNWYNNSKSSSRKIKLSGRVFYNHNYGLLLSDSSAFNQDIDSATLSTFSSIIHKENVFGFQFHPEKSQELGETLLKMLL